MVRGISCGSGGNHKAGVVAGHTSYWVWGVWARLARSVHDAMAMCDSNCVVRRAVQRDHRHRLFCPGCDLWKKQCDGRKFVTICCCSIAVPSIASASSPQDVNMACRSISSAVSGGFRSRVFPQVLVGIILLKKRWYLVR
jgi:hypothetical protein